MLKKIKENKGYLFAFLIPLIIVMVGLFSLGLLYGDGKTIFVSDMDAQYKTLFIYLKEHFFDSFSFGKGLGGPMIGTIAYYLMSPFNFIALFFSNTNMYIGILLILVLKISLSGLTMYIYIKYHNPKGRNLLLFSTCYALMGYVVAYIFHIMWFDCIYLLPLILLGIDFIIKKKKPVLYIVTLCMAIFTNYYIGYMICIFSVLYVLYKTFITYTYKRDKKEIFSILRKFTISSLLAGMMTAALLVPTVLEFKNMPKSDISVFEMQPLSIETNPINFLSKFFIGQHNHENILSYNNFHIYAGILIFILLFLYFFNKKIPKKEKYASAVMLGIFLISIFVNYIDYAWHGFNIPVCFYGRYTFIVSFFMILLALRCFQNMDGLDKKHYFVIAPIYPVMGTIVMLGQLSIVKIPLIFVSVGIYFLYLVLLYAYGTQKENRKMIEWLLLFLVAAELLMNLFFCLEDYKFRTVKETKEDYKSTENQIDTIKEKEKDVFYRLEKNYSYSATDSLYFDYKGVSTFLSTVDKKQLSFLGNVGYNVHNNIIEYSDYSPVTDSLFGIKYILQKTTKNPYYEKLNTFKISTVGFQYHNILRSDVTVYRNQNAMSLGTLVSKNASHCKIGTEENDRLGVQNKLMHCLYGKPMDIYEKIPLEKKSKHEYTLKNTKKLDMFLYPGIQSDYLVLKEQVKLSINDILLGLYSNNSFAIQEFQNNADIGKEFTIKTINEKNKNKEYIPYAYYFNPDTYNKVFKELNQNSLEVTYYKDNKIKGTMNATQENHYLFTTIPYDKNWTLYVDGQKTKFDSVWDMFIGFDVSPGKHEIEMVYQTEGLKIGVVISIMSFITCIFYLFKQKGKN